MAETNTTEKPVKIGQRLTIIPTIEGEKGDAIHKINNFIIIIRKGNANIKYEVEITAIYATYAFAKIIKQIKEKSATDIMKEIDDKEE